MHEPTRRNCTQCTCKRHVKARDRSTRNVLVQTGKTIRLPSGPTRDRCSMDFRADPALSRGLRVGPAAPALVRAPYSPLCLRSRLTPTRLVMLSAGIITSEPSAALALRERRFPTVLSCPHFELPVCTLPFALSRSAARKRSICVACCAAGFSSPVRCATGRRRSSHSLVLSQEVVRCRLLRGYASRLLRRRLEDLVVLREVLVKLEDGRHVAATVAIVGRGPDGDQRV